MPLGPETFTDFGGAASAIFGGILGGQADQIKAQGDLAEAGSYDMAAGLALQNEQFTKTQTAVNEMQSARQIYQTISQQEAGVAGGGLAESGSAIDLLRSSASQGALSQAIIGEQGQITEASYQEQHDSYVNMSNALKQAASEESSLGSLTGIFGGITGAIKGAAGIATLLPP